MSEKNEDVMIVASKKEIMKVFTNKLMEEEDLKKDPMMLMMLTMGGMVYLSKALDIIADKHHQAEIPNN